MMTELDAKKIFLLDDEQIKFDTYLRFLKKDGFDVKGATTVKEAEKLLEANERFDLLLLDMNLKEDPVAVELNLYGSDVGAQFTKKQAEWPPEVLTITNYHDNVDLWRRSFAIGAVALIEKTFTSVETTINYARSVLLRRAVSLNNPRCKTVMTQVLKNGGSEYQALGDFIRQMILPEFTACLRSPFILVLEHQNGSGQDAPVAHPRKQSRKALLQEEIAKLVAKASYYTQLKELTEPLLLDTKVFDLGALPQGNSATQVFLRAPIDELLDTDDENSLKNLLEDAAFIPLQLTSEVRLGVLLVKDKRLSKMSPDWLPLPLAKLLVKYSLDSLRMTLTNLIERWKHEEEVKQVQLEELARFCQYVGTETRRLNFGAKSEGFTPDTHPNFHKLTLLASELCEAGDFLSDLRQEAAPRSEVLVIQQIIQEAWNNKVKAPGLLLFRGDCQATVRASKDELLFLFSRLLHWLVSFYEDEPEATPHISIECRLDGAYLELSLESDSVRLHENPRDNIFVPMTQRINYDQVLDNEGPKLFLAMYLAKIILEKRYQGSLTDHSNELSDGVGHKLVMRMAVLNPSGDYFDFNNPSQTDESRSL